eukprot:CAMPEP_0197921688 /NCGR_PEP_ID=MMETSP1439-20131203/91052_1 /TAXON_ID=66791 /ORGANISM="Gonyaulax spinifera, Strain CCMP409" /LENGTH=50 /DNA_ID=CAMNT_0043543947 /DNA_START=135 /DNA_END=284 /DNA_ORIENTATION=+
MPPTRPSAAAISTLGGTAAVPNARGIKHGGWSVDDASLSALGGHSIAYLS